MLTFGPKYYATKIEQEQYLPYNDVFYLGTKRKKKALMDNKMLLDTFIQRQDTLLNG